MGTRGMDWREAAASSAVKLMAGMEALRLRLPPTVGGPVECPGGSSSIPVHARLSLRGGGLKKKIR